MFVANYEAKVLVPIIMVTAQTEHSRFSCSLEAGADDYVTKPVVAKELAARIRAALRRTTLLSTSSATIDRFTVRDVEMRSDQGIVLKVVSTSAHKNEYRLLHIFMENANKVLSRDQLLELFGVMNISETAGLSMRISDACD